MKKLFYTALLMITSALTFAQTFPIVWTSSVNTTINADNSLTKAGGVNGVWDAGVASQNLIASGTDGYIEFTYPGGTANAYMAGLSRLNVDPSYVSSDYVFYVAGNSLYVYVQNSNQGGFGTLTANDVLKVAREGNVVNFYKNATVIKTIVLTDNTSSLRADVSISTGTVPIIVASFRPGLMVKPQFTYPSLANNDGGINLQIEGQYNPVTYSWSTGETTSSITGKSRAIETTYTATVTDAQGRVVTHSYGLGYPISWTNLNNVLVNPDNTLTKTNTLGWTAGASSLNFLPANTDGWIEFVVNEPASSYVIGFSRIDKDASNGSIIHGWYVGWGGNIVVYEAGTNVGLMGTLVKGDVLRVAREGSSINYYLNGVLRRTVATPANKPLVADVSINDNYGPIPVISASFDKQIRVLPSFTLPNVSTTGSIALNIQGVHTPATISWSSGETNNIITNKLRGKYTVIVTDAASRTFTRSYQLGYPVNWTDLQNISLKTDNTLAFETASSSSWGSGAISANILPPSTDGWMEFALPHPSSQVMLGLSRLNTSTLVTSIDFSFYFLNGDVYVYQNGANLGVVASQVDGDIYTIAREGANIKFYVNDIVVKTVATTPTYQLHVDVGINVGSIPMITTSFSRTPQTFYSRANGAWTTPATWSLTEGGAAATVYPGVEDNVVIKGFTVSVNSGIYVNQINIVANNDNTSLVASGINASVNVKNNVVISGDNNANMAKALVTKNNALITVQP